MKLFLIISICILSYASAALLTVNQFKNCVSVFGYGTPTEKVASAFIDQAEKNGNITTQREAFMAISQMAWESWGFTQKSEVACSNGKWSKWPCESYDKKGCPEGKNYYGRGYIQLTHCFNYKAAAKALNDSRIVNDPDIVARDENIAMATALWFWQSNVHIDPGVQQGHFGSCTWCINGALECKGDYKDRAKERWRLFTECTKKAAVGNLGVSENGCYN